MSLYHELKRRNVFRVAIAYLAGSWLLVEVAETIFPLFGFDDTPARILVIVLAIGFPLFLLFSWVFEITPEGLKKEKDIDRTASVTHKTGKQLDRIIIVLLALALGYFAFDKFVLDPVEDVQIAESALQKGRSDALTESYGDRSIAVLPFVNMSADPEQEYFSDGISEELLNLLAKTPELRVIARTSSFSYKGKDVKIADVARELNVGYVLEGSVRKAGDRVRITAQLIDARSDTHLWSETYDRELVDIFSVQDEISTSMFRALKEHLRLGMKKAPRVIAAANTEAHDAYLRGRYLMVQRTGAALEGAIHEFEKAITLDPDYALAHAELSIAILLQPWWSDLSFTEAVAKAAPHAERAMAIEPTLAEAHAATGFVFGVVFANQKNLEEALRRYEQAIQINPNYSVVYLWMAQTLYSGFGRYAESFAAYEKALHLDPLSIPAISNYFFTLVERNRLDEAHRVLEKLASISPVYYTYNRTLLSSYGGNWANAILGNLDALSIDSENGFARFALHLLFAILELEKESLAARETPHPVALWFLGKPEEAVTTAEARFVDDPLSTAARWRGMALAGVGDYTRAGPILQQLWHKSGGRITSSGQFQYFDALALIGIRRTAGEVVEAGELETAIRGHLLRYREAEITAAGVTAGYIGNSLFLNVDLEEGLADYLAGERENGLTLIAKGVDGGYLVPPELAFLQTLYNDPGFTPIHASQEAHRNRQREIFLTIVCTDNPYEQVWQPAEGTCKRFAAEGKN